MAKGFSCYGKKGITFHKGVPEEGDLSAWYGWYCGGILVLDDLITEGGNNENGFDLFTKDSHHCNITVLYLCQDLFPPGKYAKTISRNAHYVVAFKNPRDKTGIRRLMIQVWCRRKHYLRLKRE